MPHPDRWEIIDLSIQTLRSVHNLRDNGPVTRSVVASLARFVCHNEGKGYLKDRVRVTVEALLDPFMSWDQDLNGTNRR